MVERIYYIISGIFFGTVAIMHLLRLLYRWSFQLGPWTLPLWVSWCGLALAAALCIWALRLAARR